MADLSYDDDRARAPEPGAEASPTSPTSVLQRRLDGARARWGQANDILQMREGGGEGGGAAAHGVAQRGVSGAGGPLPFGEQIQASFGRHDVSGVGAHTGGAARNAATALGAQAYATGDQVAFRGAPDLHTTAHEAAHVVQQRRGVSLKDGLGRAGDAYEQHADAVADAVVQGRSAEGILDAGPSGGGGGAVQLDADPTVSDQEALRAALQDGGEAAARQMLVAAGPDKRAAIEQAISATLGAAVLERLQAELAPDEAAADGEPAGDPPSEPPGDDADPGEPGADGPPAGGGDPTSEGGGQSTEGGDQSTEGGDPATEGGDQTTEGGDPTAGGDQTTEGGDQTIEGGDQTTEGGDPTAGGGSDPTAGGGGPTAGLDQVSTGGLTLVHEELIEHERWGAALGRVGEARSAERAQWIAEQAAIGFGQGAATGFVMGVLGGAVGEAATRFVPIPGVGAIIGGAFGAYSLATKNWEEAGNTIAAFGTGDSGYEVAANTIASVSEVLDIIINVLRTINAVAGAVAAVMWLVSILTVGAASPLAAAISGVTLTVGGVLEIIDNINNGILQPLVVVLRALHAFQDQADPREVEADGAALQDASMKFGSMVGGFVGGKVGEAGVRSADARFNGAGGGSGGDVDAPSARAGADAQPRTDVEYGQPVADGPAVRGGDDGPAVRGGDGDGPTTRADGDGPTRADGPEGVEASNVQRETGLERLRSEFDAHRQRIRQADAQLRADAEADRARARSEAEAQAQAELEAKLRGIDEEARVRDLEGRVDDAGTRRDAAVDSGRIYEARAEAAGTVKDAALADAEAKLGLETRAIDSADAKLREQIELEYMATRREFTESLRGQDGAHDLPETRAAYDRLDADYQSRIEIHDRVVADQRAEVQSQYRRSQLDALQTHGRALESARAEADARVEAGDAQVARQSAARDAAHEQAQADARAESDGRLGERTEGIDGDPRYEQRHQGARDQTAGDSQRQLDDYRDNRSAGERLHTVREGMGEQRDVYRNTPADQQGSGADQAKLNRPVGKVVENVGKKLLEDALKAQRQKTEGFAEGHTRQEGGSAALFEAEDRSRINPAYEAPPGTPEELDAIQAEVSALLDARAQAEQAESQMNTEQQTCEGQQGPLQEVVGMGDDLMSKGDAQTQSVSDTTAANTEQQTRQADSTTQTSDMASQASQIAALRGPLSAFKGFAWVLDKVGVGGNLHADATAFETSLASAQATIQGEVSAGPDRQSQLTEDAGRLDAASQQATQTTEAASTGRDDAQALADLNAQRTEEARSAGDQSRDQKAQLDGEIATREARHQTLTEQLLAWAQGHRAAREAAIREQQQRRKGRS